MPSVYEALMERLEQHEVKPFAIRMTQKQWNQLVGDARTEPRDFTAMAGDPPLFKGVPVRIASKRETGHPYTPEVFATAEALHEAIYGP